MSDTPPPWKTKNPRKASARRTLTPEQKASAKASAEAAGRPYPNLIDNMRALRGAAGQAIKAPKKRGSASPESDGESDPPDLVDSGDSPLI